MGLGLLGLAVVTAFTGYALPYDNYAVTATRIGYGIAGSIPWIGATLAEVMFGGEFPGSARSIPRLYSLHVLWLPLLLMALIGLHLVIMVKQKHTQPPYAQRVAPGKILGVPMYPQQMVMMLVLFALYVGLMTMIAGAFLAHPIEAFGPPTPNTPAVKPDWYFLWIYGILQLIPSSWEFRLLGATIGPEFIGGALVPGVLALIGLLLPFVDTRKDKMRYMELPSEHPVRTSAILALLVFFLMASLAGYKIDFQQQGLLLGNNAVLWTWSWGAPPHLLPLLHPDAHLLREKRRGEGALIPPHAGLGQHGGPRGLDEESPRQRRGLSAKQAYFFSSSSPRLARRSP